jgi:hypothetical protein
VSKPEKKRWAREHTVALTHWRRRAVFYIVGAVVGILGLAQFGSESGLTDELLVVAGAAMVAAVLTAAEYGVNYIRAGTHVAVTKARQLEIDVADAKRERDDARAQLDRRDERAQARDLLAAQRQAALDLKNRPVSTDKEFGAWATEFERWHHVTSLLIGEVFGPPEVQRFKDPGHIMATKVIGSFNNEHNSSLLWLDRYREYLTELDTRLVRNLDQL